MTQHLLQIHIGPMQAFIAAARRTRDLWFGSWLMSELSKAAARGIAEEAGKDALIFPSAPLIDLEPDSTLGVANKIVALVDDPQEAATAAWKTLDARYNQLIQAVSLPSLIDKHGQQIADTQLHSFLEFYWVSYPVKGSYAETCQHVDGLMAARKSIRTFQAVSWDGAGRPKSSLDGQMETVIPSRLSTQAMYTRFRARSGEQLSGVDLFKRLGQGEDATLSRFPSTSHMAAVPLRAKLQAKVTDAQVQLKWTGYLNSLPPEIPRQEIIYHRLELPILGQLDGSLLFESRLLDYVDKQDLPPLKKRLGDFLQIAEIKEGDLNPYYTLLVGDGDSMGAAISSMKDAQAHQAFSQRLAQFARDARDIVETHDGAVVYAGGDDVLALLPLHTAVAAAAELAQTFEQSLSGLTFSAGIAIVHHLEPLEDALVLAREAVREAKDIDGKNALALILSKRGGAPRLVLGRWGEVDTRLTQFAHYYRRKELPQGLPHQLRDMFLRLGGHTAVKNSPGLKDVLAKEAERIIKRKEGSEEAALAVQTAVTQIDYDKTSIETMSSELIIAAHIAQAQELAQQSGQEEDV